jgi:hypothetical protein
VRGDLFPPPQVNDVAQACRPDGQLKFTLQASMVLVSACATPSIMTNRCVVQELDMASAIATADPFER